jgi:quercetin dioxygenase-like cupin family protein
MSGVLIRIAIVMALLPVGPAAARQMDDQSGSPLSAAVCELAPPELGGGDEQVAATPFAVLPRGLSLVVLTNQSPTSWPRYARGLVMTVRQLTLDPDVVSEMRITQGPLLFYVEGGTVGISINSRMAYYEPGSAVLVELGQHYLLRNDSAESVRLVRVQLTPPETETTVARSDPAAAHGVERAAVPGPPFLASRLLLTTPAPAMREGTRLVLACLTWADPAVEARDIAHPGPVALLVLAGQLLVGETGIRATGDCVVYQAGDVHRLRAGDPPPVVLMIGAIPAGSELWRGASAVGGSRSSVGSTPRCGEETAAGAAPDAGSMSARDRVPVARQ